MATRYRWEVSPKEAFSNWTPIPTALTDHTMVEGLPFREVPKRELEGTPYHYQIAVSSRSLAQDIVAIRDLVERTYLSSDPRSGVLVYHGHLLVASYMIPGVPNTGHHLAVREGYRGGGLSKRIIEQWFRETPMPSTWPQQYINLGAAKAFLGAYRMMLTWAVRSGKQVPPTVLNSFEDEISEILSQVEKVVR